MAEELQPGSARVQAEIAGACAVVVTYEPDSRFPARLQLLCEQFPEVLVIDNASDQARAFIDIAANMGGVQVVRNPSNLGVARALNVALEILANRGRRWMVTFDQDTIIRQGLLVGLLDVALAEGSRPVLVGANYRHVHGRRLAAGRPAKESVAKRRRTLITSGMLVPIDFALRIGGFRQDYFIDSVDHEFCLRAAANGAAILMTPQPLMDHHIGKAGHPLGAWLSSGHPPSRKYFIARNAIATIRRYCFDQPAWSMRQLLRLLGEVLGMLVFEGNKRAKLAAFSRGLRDGWRMP